VKAKIHFRVRWRKMGGHFLCRIFSGGTSGTFAKIGELTMDEEDFAFFQNEAGKTWEFLEDGK